MFFKVYIRIDQPKNLSWWLDFRTVVNGELRKLSDDVRTSSLRDSIHGSVQQDVTRILTVSLSSLLFSSGAADGFEVIIS